MSVNNSIGLLRCVCFFNAILLGLCGANNIQAQKEKLYIPNIPEIINMYELYFSKYPTQFIKFYNFLKNQLTKVLNFPTITLEGNFITAKSLINDDINKSNSTCQPLQDLNIVQEKPKQRLEELISKLTADKVFINFVVIFNNSGNAGRNYNRTMEWLGHVSVEGRSSEDDSRQLFAVSGRFLDNSFLDDLNNIIFFMALEQFWGETSWYVGSLNGMIMVLLDKANNEFLFLQVFWIGNVDAMRYQRHLRRIKLCLLESNQLEQCSKPLTT
ncbi:2932_t:CDS:10 [Rhizophagus irregularis]|nr:2932_t:CDS:10 [Rhizophagus irregularis]